MCRGFVKVWEDSSFAGKIEFLSGLSCVALHIHPHRSLNLPTQTPARMSTPVRYTPLQPSEGVRLAPLRVHVVYFRVENVGAQRVHEAQRCDQHVRRAHVLQKHETRGKI